jgi:hypothetical protein
VVDLIKVWLKERSYFVSIDGMNSELFDLFLGTVQGSIMDPVLYAISVYTLFDLDFLLGFGDDNFIPKTQICKITLIKDVEKSLESLTKWLKKSRLKAKINKTELCLFYNNDTALVSIALEGTFINSTKSINVLGVNFLCKIVLDPTYIKHICQSFKISKCLKT